MHVDGLFGENTLVSCNHRMTRTLATQTTKQDI